MKKLDEIIERNWREFQLREENDFYLQMVTKNIAIEFAKNVIMDLKIHADMLVWGGEKSPEVKDLELSDIDKYV